MVILVWVEFVREPRRLLLPLRTLLYGRDAEARGLLNQPIERH